MNNSYNPSESATWLQNELVCLNLGLNYEEHLIVSANCRTYLILQRRDNPAHHPEFTSYSSRIETFKDWPKYMKPRPTELAKSGFFYRGPADRVTCYCCNVTLLNWKPTVDPHSEHSRHSPTCPLLKIHTQDISKDMTRNDITLL